MTYWIEIVTWNHIIISILIANLKELNCFGNYHFGFYIKVVSISTQNKFSYEETRFEFKI